jgi:hypothetical protein
MVTIGTKTKGEHDLGSLECKPSKNTLRRPRRLEG